MHNVLTNWNALQNLNKLTAKTKECNMQTYRWEILRWWDDTWCMCVSCLLNTECWYDPLEEFIAIHYFHLLSHPSTRLGWQLHVVWHRCRDTLDNISRRNSPIQSDIKSCDLTFNSILFTSPIWLVMRPKGQSFNSKTTRSKTRTREYERFGNFIKIVRDAPDTPRYTNTISKLWAMLV